MKRSCLFVWSLLCCIALLAACSPASAPIESEPDYQYLFRYLNSDATNFAHPIMVGYINEFGDVIVPPFSGRGEDFSDGFALVAPDNTAPYFIDKTGTRAFGEDYIALQSFSENRARIEIDGVQYMIDTQGNLLFEYRYSNQYHDGVLVTSAPQDAASNQQRYEAYGLTGELLFAVSLPVHNPANAAEIRFHEGMACVLLERGIGYLDKSGTLILEVDYDHPLYDTTSLCPSLQYRFSDGRALVSKDGLYGYIDTEGREVIPLQFQSASVFSEGLAFVVTTDGTAGYINLEGELVITGDFTSGRPFSEGVAFVSKTIPAYAIPVACMIDQNGNMLTDYSFFIFPPGSNSVFDMDYMSKHGLVYVYSTEKSERQFIDHQGNVVFSGE